MYLLKVGILFAAYFLTAKFGLSLEPVGGFATLVWPPTGIALASILLFGHKVWPGIFLAALLVNYQTGAPLLVALGMASGNTLEALAGAYILNRFGFLKSLERLKDVLLFIVYGALFSTLISASIGSLSLLLGGIIRIELFQQTFLSWWVGDGLGALVVAPLILAWADQPFMTIKDNFWGKLAIFSILIITALVIFKGLFGIDTTNLPITYILFPSLILVTLCFSLRESSSAIFIISAIALWGTVEGHGVFIREKLIESLLLLQGFIGVASITSMILTAALSERRILEKRKDDFISVASHELKTPLTTVKGYIQLLPSLITKGDLKKSLASLKRIDYQLDKLTKMANDLLDISAISTGKLSMEMERVVIDSLVEQIAKDMQATTKTHKIIVTGRTGSIVKVDRYRINQVLVNLISNAIKFSPNGEKVLVSISSKRRQVVVSVQDFGIGIDPKIIRDIFKQYFQARPNSEYAGMGLGLYIASEIVKKHRGEIWVKSKLGKGSTFSFSLPKSFSARNL